VEYPGKTLESADSNVLVVMPKDVFPPAAPLGLVVAVVLTQGGTPAHLELSWAISPETDVAGYNIYRSEQAGAPGTRLNNELLLAPAFSDMNIQPGRRYFYSVTAVDRSGNESPKSAVVSGGVPAEGQPTP
jgi:fibronectin type 3 domain-containing protein